MGRRIVIADIHGCYDELRELLERCAVTDDDEVIAVGDLVNRGPRSEDVLRYFADTPQARSVMGNHEYEHLRQGQVRPTHRLGLEHTRAALGPRYGDWLSFMARLPLLIELPEALVFHGAWEPGVAAADQRPAVLLGLRPAEHELHARLGRSWYDCYDGPKPAIVGHHHYRKDGRPLVCAGRVYAIDTSCARGAALTAVVLPEFEIVSVPAREDYWGRLKARLLENRK